MKLAERLGPGKFRLLTRRTTLPAATDDGKAIADAALALWTANRPRIPVRLLGVAAAGVAPAAAPQLALFDERADRRTALNSALDRVLARFGDGAIARGGRVIEKDLTSQVKRGMGEA
jgi:DNA polymerase-4